MRKWIKDIVPVLAGFLTVFVLFGVTTTPVIAGQRQQVQVTYQHDLVQGRSSCAKVSDGFEGRAVIGHELLLAGGMTVAWCYQKIQGPLATDKIVGEPTVNTWAEGHLGWSFDGIKSKVKGHGTNCADGHCWEYYYYRYYFSFSRGWGPAHQTCTPFVNITVRGNGTAVTGHSDGGIC